ncbi:MAG TPA: gamma carbonic anhydrase family protein [Candidatus Polarisedimenticolia bacterium]|nr:gamma carbonic anhydrase family protein [Candidatus Polarisedimenticolia bacterium]
MSPRQPASARVVIDPTAFIAPGAALVGDVAIGAGASVWFNATLRGDLEAIVIGAESNVQDNCVVHVDVGQPARIGARVTLGHGAIVHAATIEDEVLVAMKAVVLSGCHVGTGSLIGAGAVVPEGTRIPPGSLVLGVPGRVVRPLRPEESERVRRNAQSYVELAAAYRAGDFDAKERP